MTVIQCTGVCKISLSSWAIYHGFFRLLTLISSGGGWSLQLLAPSSESSYCASSSLLLIETHTNHWTFYLIVQNSETQNNYMVIVSHYCWQSCSPGAAANLEKCLVCPVSWQYRVPPRTGASGDVIEWSLCINYYIFSTGYMKDTVPDLNRRHSTKNDVQWIFRKIWSPG